MQRDSNSFKINLKNLEGEDLEVNIKPELYFHPEFGHCETLNLGENVKFLACGVYSDLVCLVSEQVKRPAGTARTAKGAAAPTGAQAATC